MLRARRERPGRDGEARRPRYESFDIWRGVLCLLITARHAAYSITDGGAGLTWAQDPLWCLLAAPIRLGGIRVPLFFVISGYCVSALCDKLRRQHPRPAAAFVRGRVRRIFRPYWAFLALSAPAAALLYLSGFTGWWWGEYPILRDPRSMTVGAWLGNVTLVEAWRPMFTRGPIKHWVGFACTPQMLWGHLGTLSEEVLFYLICAGLLGLMPRRFFGGLAGVTAAVVGVLVATGSWLLPTEWLSFALGALLYGRLNDFRARPAVAADALVAALLVGALIAERAGLVPATPARMLAASSGFVLLLTLLRPWDARLAAAPALAPLSRCGTISYSVYLVHVPVCTALDHLARAAGWSGPWTSLLVVIPLSVAASLVAGATFASLFEPAAPGWHRSRGAAPAPPAAWPEPPQVGVGAPLCVASAIPRRDAA